MSMRRPDPQLQRAWRSKPPRSQRIVQGALAVVAALGVGIAGALLVRSCSDDDGDAAPAVLPPLSSSTSTTSTTSTTTPPVIRTYEIRQGDSLFSIAQLFGISVTALAELNGIDDPDRIEAGQILQLPPNATSTSSTSSVPTADATTSAGATTDTNAPAATTAAP